MDNPYCSCKLTRVQDGEGFVWVAEDRRPAGSVTGPSSATFHEGNGGEFRLSYHGYSKVSALKEMTMQVD